MHRHLSIALLIAAFTFAGPSADAAPGSPPSLVTKHCKKPKKCRYKCQKWSPKHCMCTPNSACVGLCPRWSNTHCSCTTLKGKICTPKNLDQLFKNAFKYQGGGSTATRWISYFYNYGNRRGTRAMSKGTISIFKKLNPKTRRLDWAQCIVKGSQVRASNLDSGARSPVLGPWVSRGCSQAKYKSYVVQCCILNFAPKKR